MRFLWGLVLLMVAITTTPLKAQTPIRPSFRQFGAAELGSLEKSMQDLEDATSRQKKAAADVANGIDRLEQAVQGYSAAMDRLADGLATDMKAMKSGVRASRSFTTQPLRPQFRSAATEQPKQYETVKIGTADWCVHCPKLKAYLKSRGLAYDEYNDPDAPTLPWIEFNGVRKYTTDEADLDIFLGLSKPVIWDGGSTVREVSASQPVEVYRRDSSGTYVNGTQVKPFIIHNVPLPPVRSNRAVYEGTAYTWPGMTEASLRRHLVNGPEHHYDPAYIASLSFSELRALHNSTHEARLGTVGSASTTFAMTTATGFRSSCPGGVCPNSGAGRRGLFGRRR